MADKTNYMYIAHSLKFSNDKVGFAITFTPSGECSYSQRVILSLAVETIEIASRFGATILSLDFENIKSLITLPEEDSATVFVMFDELYDVSLFVDEMLTIGIFW